MLLSYGPCQFPTLGFVVSRNQEIIDFVPEVFWALKLNINTIEGAKKSKKADLFELNWSRVRLFDELKTQIILDECKKAEAIVSSVEQKEVYKKRPIPLNTIEA